MEVKNINKPDKVISVYKILEDGNNVGWVSINKDYKQSLSMKEFNKISPQDK